MEYTIANMIDQLITTNLKIFKFEDLKREKDRTDKEIADATRATNDLNSMRNKLIAEIDKKINEMVSSGKTQELQTMNTVKSYGK